MAEKKKMRASSATRKQQRTATKGGGAGGRTGRGTPLTRRAEETLERADEAQQRFERSRRQQHQPKGAKQAVLPPEMAEPVPPMPAQHQEHPGIEAAIEPAPRFEAPAYRPAHKLEGQVALITGGDSGIGRAVALLYAREGADVAIVYLSEHEDAAVTQAAVEAVGRRCLLIPGDVSDAEFCREAVEQTVNELGGLDILVNNAAFQQNQSSIEDLTEAQWDLTFRTNIYGYFHMVKAALPHLREGAAIINTGSITGLRGNKHLLDYASTKGAIHAFTKSLAQSLVQKGIRVNCVAPGPVWTPLNIAAGSAEGASKFGANTPMGRPAQPEEIAPAYVYFASTADSSYVTGEVLTLLGGEIQAG